MKTKSIFIIVILVILVVVFNTISKKEETIEFKPLEIDVGDEFTGIDYGTTMYVLNYEIDDVTGDGEKDMIIVIGEKSEVSETNATNIDVVVYDTINARVAVFEAKYTRALDKLESECDIALEQIDERMYAKEYEDDYDNILCYGISFFKKRCLVKKK